MRVILGKGFLLKKLRIKQKIKCFGYHFSALSKYQHSIFRKINFNYEPDIIYTAGVFQKKNLKTTSHKVKVLGSVRFFKKKSFKRIR